MSTWWERKLSSPGTPSAPPPLTPTPSAPPPAAPPRPTSPGVEVTPDNFAEMSTQWQGGEGTRTETSRCPNCGSDLFFSRSNAGTMVSVQGSVTPAPRCYACGFTQGREMQGVPAT